jgi:uncharacterized membrane protein YfcA
VLHTAPGFVAACFGISILGGILGSLVGIGGGIIVTPLLTGLLGVDIHYAIGASVVSIIATSSGAAASYLREDLTNLRIGVLLEVATTLGALLGAMAAGHLGAAGLFALFGLALGLTALASLRQPDDPPPAGPPDALALRLGLRGRFHDPATGRDVEYVARRVPAGAAIMGLAGFLSGLLGIGAGVVKVLALDTAMGLPLKVSTATSNFMIGVTAAASAGVYYWRGQIDPLLVAPVALGILLGAFGGSKLMPRMRSRHLRLLFVATALVISGQMIWSAIHLARGA